MANSAWQDLKKDGIGTLAKRILIVDDNESIHEDFRNILGVHHSKKDEIKSLENELFGDGQPTVARDNRSPGEAYADVDISYQIDDAYQGEEAIRMVDDAEAEGKPYSLIFMDVRMPPGIDGIQTIKRIWKKYKHIEMVICTAFSDYSWDDIIAMFGQTDHLLFVKKPFISVEIKQIALTLTTKWLLDREKKQYLHDLEKNIEAIMQSEENLRRSQEEYRNLYETPVIGLFRSRLSDGKLIKANKSALKLFGYESLEKALEDGFRISDYYPEDKRKEIFSRLADQKMINRFEIHFSFPGGRDMDASTTFKLYPEDNYIEGAILDITEAKRAEKELAKKEQQLIQAQKMETVGNLAGGLAHDFNNVLGGIIGTVSLMEFAFTHKKRFNETEVRKHLVTIKEAANRAADMVKQLLTLSRKHDLCLAPVDLNMSLRMVMKICRNSFDKSIEMTAKYAPEKAMIFADPTQIEQTILNLCVNAAHAMTIMRKTEEMQGGRLTVAIEKIEAEQHFCQMHPEAVPGDYWLLRVTDTGVGMESRIIAKIFDPFFTTKENHRGTGLGLAMVYNIVKQHKGFIDVYSEVGNGTSFNIFLPAMADDMDYGKDEVVDEPLPMGSGLILVVDDEIILRETAKAILEECGYDIILAEDGIEAVEYFKQHHKEIKAVLMDMSMPRKSGKEAYIEMKAIDPNIKTIMTSGYKQDERVQSVLELGIDDFIQKPYSVLELTQKIKDLIG